MGAHTSRSRNSPSTSMTRRARLSPASSAVAPSTRLSSPTNINKAENSKVRPKRRRDVAVRRKMEALRRLVPSDGDTDEVDEDELLLRAAGYIARLQAQVRVMQLMVDVLEHAQD